MRRFGNGKALPNLSCNRVIAVASLIGQDRANPRGNKAYHTRTCHHADAWRAGRVGHRQVRAGSGRQNGWGCFEYGVGGFGKGNNIAARRDVEALRNLSSGRINVIAGLICQDGASPGGDKGDHESAILIDVIRVTNSRRAGQVGYRQAGGGCCAQLRWRRGERCIGGLGKADDVGGKLIGKREGCCLRNSGNACPKHISAQRAIGSCSNGGIAVIISYRRYSVEKRSWPGGRATKGDRLVGHGLSARVGNLHLKRRTKSGANGGLLRCAGGGCNAGRWGRNNLTDIGRTAAQMIGIATEGCCDFVCAGGKGGCQAVPSATIGRYACGAPSLAIDLVGHRAGIGILGLVEIAYFCGEGGRMNTRRVIARSDRGVGDPWSAGDDNLDSLARTRTGEIARTKPSIDSNMMNANLKGWKSR